jgi:hypothetical protein
MGAGSASPHEWSDERWSEPLRWRASAGEDVRGVRRLAPRGPEAEDPRARGTPRAEGEEASHTLPRFPDGDSGARANRESGRQDPVTDSCLSVDRDSRTKPGIWEDGQAKTTIPSTS